MRKILLAFVLVLSLAATAVADTGSFTVKQVYTNAASAYVVIEHTNGTRYYGNITNDENKKYYISTFLTALSSGKNVNCGLTYSAGKVWVSWVSLVDGS